MAWNRVLAADGASTGGWSARRLPQVEPTIEKDDLAGDVGVGDEG
jgi:hypothetical protein